MRSTAAINSKGFTLVEALVAGVLSIVVLVTLISLFSTNTKLVSGNLVRSLTKMHYQTVIDQIAGKARGAKLVAPFGAGFVDTSAVVYPSDTIFFFDSTGTVVGGYKHSDTTLWEWDGTHFVKFRVGSEYVRVLNTGKAFIVTPDRKSVVLNLSVYGADDLSKDTVLSKRESFKCRY